MKKIAVLLLAAFILMPSAAHALCSSPPGAAGDQIYNSSHNVMQYCNGNQWIAMGSGGGGGGGADTLGNLSCNNGESVEFDGTNWNCVGGKVSRAGDTMTGTLTLSPPTAGAHAATKSYVDAAVAGAAGGGGGGSTTCMYFKAANHAVCPNGWEQIGQNDAYRQDGVDHKVCCMGGGALGDEMPSTFDFPDSPALAANAAHTWTPVQVSGFDSATVNLSVTPITGNTGTAEFRTCADAGCSNVLKGWRTQATGIADGNYLQIRINAASSNALRPGGTTITVTVGGMSDTAKVTSDQGDYYLAFVTSTTTNGQMGGAAGADGICQARAQAAGWTGTFRAWLTTSTAADLPVNRFENATTAAKFIMPANNMVGVKIADSWADLTDNSIDAQFNRSETGATLGTVNVWTNLTGNGSMVSSDTSSNCSNFNNDSTGRTAGFGRTNYASSNWTFIGTQACDALNRLYCMQTVW